MTARTLDQNAALWAALSDIARQKKHCGRWLTAPEWKILFQHALGHEVKLLPSLNGAAFVPYCQSSTTLTRREMAKLLDAINTWAALNGVTLHTNREHAA